jgi:hypothetical protein
VALRFRPTAVYRSASDLADAGRWLRMRRHMPTSNSFAESTFVLKMRDASFFATDLFFEAFGQPFPRPRDTTGLSIPTPDDAWHQFVAFYKWTETNIEPVAFVNFIRFGDVYLEGGLCARRNFYRRLPPAHWRECKAHGGIVQIMLEKAMRHLDDADAWFGHSSNNPAWLVNERLGMVVTRHQYLKVKWFRDLPDARKREIEDGVNAIGSF